MPARTRRWKSSSSVRKTPPARTTSGSGPLEAQAPDRGSDPGDDLVGLAVDDLVRDRIALAGRVEHERRDLDMPSVRDRPAVDREGQRPGPCDAEMGGHRAREERRRAAAILGANGRREPGHADRSAASPIARDVAEGVEARGPAVRSDAEAVHPAAADDADPPRPVRAGSEPTPAIVDDEIGGCEAGAPAAPA